MLYEVAITENPVAKKDEERGLEKLVLGPICVVAKDPQAAAIGAVLDNTAKLAKIDRTRMQVMVRPFAA